MNKQAEDIYIKMTSYSNPSKLGAYEKSWIVRCIRDGLLKAVGQMRELAVAMTLLGDHIEKHGMNEAHKGIQDILFKNAKELTEGYLEKGELYALDHETLKEHKVLSVDVMAGCAVLLNSQDGHPWTVQLEHIRIFYR